VEQLDRLRDASEFSRSFLFRDEESGDLTLDAHCDEHRAWLGGGLNARGDVRRVAEHFAGRLHDDRPRLDADAS
jgi:hypothetical protein